MSKVAVVTGASTGLGISIAIQLAAKGVTTIATMRDLGKREALDKAAVAAGVKLEVRQLDVQDSTSVSSCISAVHDEYGGIDVLVNNAGAGFIRSTEQATEEEVEWVMDVNYFGTVRCIKAVLPSMRQARSGHIVNITSVGGLVGQPFNEFYCAAKFAVEGYTEAMASYVQPEFGIKFTAVEPGGISTEFANNVLGQLASTGGILDDEYKPILERYIGGRGNRDTTGIMQTPDEVAEVVVACIENPDPPIRTRTSVWSNDLCGIKTQADPDGKKLQEKVIKAFL